MLSLLPERGLAHPQPVVRPLRTADLDAVMAIQSACYTAFAPESRDAMAAKPRLAPGTCWVASAGAQGRPLAYLLALPWRQGEAPALDAVLDQLPPAPDCLYLHDLAVAPEARALGLGAALVERFLATLRRGPWRRAALIAVQDAAPYWQRHGFVRQRPDAALAAKLCTYGPGAQYMLRDAQGTAPGSTG